MPIGPFDSLDVISCYFIFSCCTLAHMTGTEHTNHAGGVLSASRIPGFSGRLTRDEVSNKWVLFTILTALNMMDLVLTETGLAMGVLVEHNPLMKTIVEHWWLAFIVKIGALGLVGFLFYLIRERSRIVEGALLVCIAWYTWVVAWNYSLIVTAL